MDDKDHRAIQLYSYAELASQPLAQQVQYIADLIHWFYGGASMLVRDPCDECRRLINLLSPDDHDDLRVMTIHRHVDDMSQQYEQHYSIWVALALRCLIQYVISIVMADPGLPRLLSILLQMYQIASNARWYFFWEHDSLWMHRSIRGLVEAMSDTDSASRLAQVLVLLPVIQFGGLQSHGSSWIFDELCRQGHTDIIHWLALHTANTLPTWNQVRRCQLKANEEMPFELPRW